MHTRQSVYNGVGYTELSRRQWPRARLQGPIGVGFSRICSPPHELWVLNGPQLCIIKNRCTRILYGYCTPMIIITARRSYASAVLGVVILSVCLSHVCFVTNPKNLPVIFLYHILITANMQSKTNFQVHRLKSYIAPKFRLKLAARSPVSGCWLLVLFSYRPKEDCIICL